MFSFSKPTDRLFVGPVHHEMKTAETLDSDHLAAANGLNRIAQGRVVRGEHITGRAPQFEMRAAGGAGVRLGVEPAVTRVLVFSPAGVAHREPGHGGVGPVVGEGPDDREARSAVRAVRKGIAVAAIRRIIDLPKAVGAGGDIREDEGRPLAGVITRPNLEGMETDRGEKRRLQALDRRSRGSLRSRRSRKLRRASGAPSTSRKTPCGELDTQPGMPISVARR